MWHNKIMDGSTQNNAQNKIGRHVRQSWATSTLVYLDYDRGNVGMGLPGISSAYQEPSPEPVPFSQTAASSRMAKLLEPANSTVQSQSMHKHVSFIENAKKTKCSIQERIIHFKKVNLRWVINQLL